MTEHYDRGWTTDVAPLCAVWGTSFPCKSALSAQVTSLEGERDTWRMRAEEVAEVVGTLQLHNERLRGALDTLIDIINSAMHAAESRAFKANDVYEEAVFARIPPFADTANTVAEERTGP